MRVPIITDEAAQAGGWHGLALRQAFAERGIDTVFVELQDCVLDLSGAQPHMQLPGMIEKPAMAFIRGIAAGTLQQVVTRLSLLHALRISCCYVYNNAKAIERTVDKGMTSFLLKQHGVPTPETWVCESRQMAHRIIQQQTALGKRLIAKPLFGSQGKGVRLIDAAHPPLPGDLFVDGVYYLQTFIDTGQRNYDYRVFIINNQPVAAMQRSGHDWLHNVARGADCQRIDDQDVLHLAVEAARVMDIDYCGVDILRDNNGDLWVVEVNSIPAWRGLQSVCDIDVAGLLVDDLLNKAHV